MITQQQALEATGCAYACARAANLRGPIYEYLTQVRQYIEQGAQPGADGWIAIPEGGMPPLGEQVLVWCKFGPHWGPMVDCWDEQHEAPLSFSSETIPIGPGWDSGSDFYDVTHWKPIGAPVAVQHPQQEQPK
jgi:hypothetical protein